MNLPTLIFRTPCKVVEARGVIEQQIGVIVVSVSNFLRMPPLLFVSIQPQLRVNGAALNVEMKTVPGTIVGPVTILHGCRCSNVLNLVATTVPIIVLPLVPMLTVGNLLRSLLPCLTVIQSSPWCLLCVILPIMLYIGEITPSLGRPPLKSIGEFIPMVLFIPIVIPVATFLQRLGMTVIIPSLTAFVSPRLVVFVTRTPRFPPNPTAPTQPKNSNKHLLQKR